MTTGQSSVALAQGFGVPGELYLDGPYRAQPGVIDSAGPNTVGFAFTQVAASAGHCSVGGTGPFFGFLANPKVAALFGTTGGGALAATLNLPQYNTGEFVYSATGLVVSVTAAANIGDLVDYVAATGAIATRLGVQPSTGAQRVANVAATGVATVSLTPAGAPPIGIGSVLNLADGQTLTVTALGTGTGGNGTYNTTGGTADHAAQAFSFNSVPVSGNVNVPGWTVLRFNTTGTSLAVIGKQ
jgi:hypothetical protein